MTINERALAFVATVEASPAWAHPEPMDWDNMTLGEYREARRLCRKAGLRSRSTWCVTESGKPLTYQVWEVAL